jgi:UDP-N-acetylglucosamine--N-acetylmuramyl-(pentapeptide) pyrophosphoryl-undecaprenol N-acetylglucosamine transferase
MTKNKTILLAAGGTGGHLFPAIAIAEELAKSQVTVHLVTDYRCKKYLTEDLPLTSYIFDLHLNMSGIFNKIKSAIKLFSACIKSVALIRRIKPDAIIGFGGYPSFPAMAAARILKIPMIIQEQNCFLGKSNRFFAKSADLIALSYKETDNIDIGFKSKLLFTGDIVRSEIRALPEKNNFDTKEFHIFVFGGSQGAKIFSSLIPDALDELKQLNPQIKISITQQASQEEQIYLAKYYANILNIKYELAEFFYNMPEIYNKTQLVIARSGASTIAELTNIGLPAIFIPYPYASEDHQYFNAMAVANSNASCCYRQNEVSSTLLAKKINELITDRELLKEASKQLLSRKSDGAKYLADTVLKIIE